MKLTFAMGTAGELIKMYPLVDLALKRGHQVKILSTDQSGDNFAMQFRDFNLDDKLLSHLLPSAQDLRRASRALSWFLKALFARTPQAIKDADIILVHGDTLSTLIGSIHAWRAGKKVAHVEAGLRSPTLFNPFPEEITRRIVSHLCDFHFCPDQQAVNNLEKAKVKGEVINTSGNTLIDAVRLIHAQSSTEVESNSSKPTALANLHRFENLNSPSRWSRMVDTCLRLAETHHLVFVSHPQTLHKLETDKVAKERMGRADIEFRDRMPFSAFLKLLVKSEMLVSDGGSNQEECFYLGKPCLLMRESTERQEGLDYNNVLSRFDDGLIENFLRNPKAWQKPPYEPKVSPTALILDCLLPRV